MNFFAVNSRSLLVVLAGCVVGALSFVAGAASSSSSTKNLVAPHRPVADGHADDGKKVRPAAIATWRFGEIAVDAAKSLLEDGASALDALEAGALALMPKEQQSMVQVLALVYVIWCLQSPVPAKERHPTNHK